VIKPFRKAANLNRKVRLSGAAWNRMAETAERNSRLEVIGMRKEEGPGGTVFIGTPTSPQLFPVRIEKTGGVQGDKTFSATWVYTARPFSFVEEPASGEDDPILSSNVHLFPDRPVGRMLYQEGKFGIGIAFYEVDGTLWLMDAGERPDTQYCSQLQSGS
jgi:hypothetical protein